MICYIIKYNIVRRQFHIMKFCTRLNDDKTLIVIIL